MHSRSSVCVSQLSILRFGLYSDRQLIKIYFICRRNVVHLGIIQPLRDAIFTKVDSPPPPPPPHPLLRFSTIILLFRTIGVTVANTPPLPPKPLRNI